MDGFESAEVARSTAARLRDDLLLLGCIQAMGFDFGHDSPSTRLSEEFRARLEAESGHHMRDNVHGLDVFADDADRETRFPTVQATGRVTASPETFAEIFRQIRAAALVFTERQRVSMQLLNDSFFPASPDAQLLTRVGSIEVLCEPGQRPPGERALLSKLSDLLPGVEALESEKSAIRELLSRAGTESIGTACRRKVRALLGEQEQEVFRSVYAARSRLVHGGQGRGRSLEAADKARHLAIALLRADIGFK
jgi:hypothetical protein